MDVIANKLWCAGIAYEIGRRERQRKIKDEEERPSVVAPASFLVGYALTTSLKLVASLFSLFRGFGADFDMSYYLGRVEIRFCELLSRFGAGHSHSDRILREREREAEGQTAKLAKGQKERKILSRGVTLVSKKTHQEMVDL